MKRGLFLFILLNCISAFSQPSKVDSLLRVIQNTKNEKIKVALFHKAVSATWDFDFAKAYSLGQQEYEIAKKINDPESKMIALTDLGMYHYFIGDYPQAGQYYQQALKAAEGKDYGEFPAYTLTRIGNLFRVQGQYDSAKEYYARTERLLKDKPRGIALGSVYFHYGWLYSELSEFSKALNYLYKARDIRYQIGDSLLIAECWRVMATVHTGMNQLDSAKYYLDKTLNVANRYQDNELVIFTDINLGDWYMLGRQTVEAIKFYDSALELLAKHDFKRYKALALFQVGKVFDSRGDYIKAIEYYLESLKINEQLNAQHDIARIYGWIGWAYSNLRNYVDAKTYAEKSLYLMKRIKDRGGEAFAQNLLGIVAFANKEYPLTLLYYDSALQIRKSLHLEQQMVNTLYHIAKTYQAQKRYDEALRYFLEDWNTAKAIHNYRIEAIAANSIGLVYAYKKDFKNAERYLAACRDVLKINGLPMDRRDNFLNYARMYSLSGRQSLATKFYEKYIALNDSVANLENSLAAIQRDALYQLDKKEKEIDLLSSENDLKTAQIDIQKSKIRFQNILLIFVLTGMVLLAIFIFILFAYYKSKSLANRELSKLNREIHEQKEEIQAQAEELIEASYTIQAINKGLESAVEERTDQLKQAYQELDTFIYRSSHDFRRPLTTFMGLAEVAKISVKDSSAIELFSKVNETAINLDRMLVKLQSVSQVASSELTHREIFFNNELDFILDHYRSAILGKKIRIDRKVTVDKPFLSYPVVIRVLLENLIENSIQFSSPQSPFIKITISRLDEGIEMTVEDNGEGIAEEFHNRIFDMYFRASEKSKGNGLGLYLVKKAIEKLKGKVDFTSKPGYGISFHIFLPDPID
jgi:signal transduction histidine kinase